jgi:hypothetical protein
MKEGEEEKKMRPVANGSQRIYTGRAAALILNSAKGPLGGGSGFSPI